MRSSQLVLSSLAAIASATASAGTVPHNLVLFVPDGLRSGSVNAQSAPAFARLRDQGVNFVNSHSLFPTSTTSNASAIATGHLLGDTGDFSNTIYPGFPISSANNTVTPFLESDPVLREVSAHFAGNYLDEDMIVAAAAASGRLSTALVGKLGPVAIFNLQAMSGIAGKGMPTLIVDDATGNEGGIAIAPQWLEAINRAGLPLKTPGRGDNGKFGDFKTPGTRSANLDQQQYFLDIVTKVVLPAFKAAKQPFVLVYWSRDPDGSQHNQGDSFGSVTPGVNGATSLAGIRSADEALATIETTLKRLDLFASTNIIVTADHGFSTIAKESKTSAAAAISYADVKPHELPVGFLSIDLATALWANDRAIKLYDPDANNNELDWRLGAHSKRGDALIGADPSTPQLIVAANGGSDLIYIPEQISKVGQPSGDVSALARRAVEALLAQDYVSGLFVDQKRVGVIPGTLALEDIGLGGSALTPQPTMVVNFRSFATACEWPDQPLLCTAAIADSPLQVGQGMHGSFSRADTWNFMAARGPDFRRRFRDSLPTSNADVGMTIDQLLALRRGARGKLLGRVLRESLRNPLPKGARSELPTASRSLVVSSPAVNGLRTVVNTQSVIDTQTQRTTVYFDAAGFPGRTVGLTEPEATPPVH